MPDLRYYTLAACLIVLLWPTCVQAQGWALVWSDEFDYEGLPDSEAWTHEVGGHGWGNQELQYYTRGRERNARVEDGHLIIEAHKERFSGSDYTSARLITRGKQEWRYGRFEVRAQLPGGRGVWPAIWMLAAEDVYGGDYWPDNGEIDIMEYVGFQPGVVHGTVHTEAFNHMQGTEKGGTIEVPDAEEAFHVYAAEWTPERIDFFVDGTKYFTFENQNTGWQAWPFDRPFFLILNIAVGGTWGGQQGVDPDIWPQRMMVDYVRVYEQDASPTVALQRVPQAPIEPGSGLTLTAEPSSPDVAHVSFYQGAALLATVEEPPYRFSVDGVPAGCYVVTAEAEGVGDWSARSEPDTVRVGEACVQAPYGLVPAPLPGTIEAEHFDLGGEGVGYHDADARNAGGVIRVDEGVDIERVAEPQENYDVGWISAGEWLAYTVAVDRGGLYALEARVASQRSSGAFRLSVDGEPLTETISFAPTGGWQTWRTIEVDSIRLEAGVHTLRLEMQASGFSLDRLTFTLTAPTDREDEPARERLRVSGAPNPFAGTAGVVFTLPEPGPVRAEVFDVQGRRVALLLDAYRAAGTHRLAFDGSGLAAGTYFVRLGTPRGQRVLPMTLLR